MLLQFEQTFLNFLLHHQEKYNRTYHFLILMDAVLSAAKHIQHYYLTGALKGNLGRAGEVNVQGEEVMRMDQIAHQIVIHYLRTTERVIHAVSEESEEIIPLTRDKGRYFFYFDPLDGSSNVSHGLPVGFLFGIAKRNLEGPEDEHLRAGRDYIAAGMFVIPTGTFTLALREAGAWRFHIDETMNFVRPIRMSLPDDRKTWELSFNEANRYTFRVAAAANKTEIRKAVESLFKVKVSAVNTVSVRGKFHRVGRSEGRRSDWKKAIITVKQGQKIDVTDLPK